jgi:hypothetical protein
VSPEGVTTDPEIVKAVLGWPLPRGRNEFWSFLGLCTCFSRFIAGSGDITKPLTQLMEEKQTFQWSSEAEATLLSLKAPLCAPPVRWYPRLGEKFVVDTDESNEKIGGVLSQIQDCQEQLVAYYSNTQKISEELLCDLTGITGCWRHWKTSTNTYMDKSSACLQTTSPWLGYWVPKTWRVPELGARVWCTSKCLGTIQEDCHRHSSTLSWKQEEESPDCYRLFNQVAGVLHHP